MSSLAPTFLFIDPCGVEGVRMADIVQFLSRQWCEVFVFFNYEGVNRIAGLAQMVGTSPTLIELFGSAERVNSLLATLGGLAEGEAREEIILEAFQSELLARSGAQFLLPFRVESESRESTSHYFLHATKDPLGFRIMKDVMWSAAKAGGVLGGGMSLLQASRGNDGLFLRADLADQRSAVLAELERGARQVRVFRKEWVERPHDLYSESSYRLCLLQLEKDGRVQVLDKSGREPAPVDKRPSRKGEATLSEDYWVRLATRT
jgi:hypothetical protein